MKTSIRPAFVCSCVLALTLLAACKPSAKAPQAKAPPPPAESASDSTTSTTNAPTITATPNPVPAGAGPGKTTISWDTGDGSWAEVYLAEPGSDEKSFAAGRKGSEPANWIANGGVYEFRLYAGTNHQNLLASVKVTRPQPQVPGSSSEKPKP